ncbi:hypothetical protein [Pseudoduganella chitinolytica]|uniref:Uncharacterized protein n=1 Tax=Pseudoduganella chitinolytica TaxID=34070 RepID=A0ABY8B9D4_9BURK|nr:hypothetical protein [Pseudoduganella chitinolytica]WEF31603.1 hypothetical protein PX653_19370 [Pseudoduganella chitinolytica]
MATGRCAIDEFSFRYLAQAQGSTGTLPLDAFEQAFQHGAPPVDDTETVDLAPLFRAVVTGTALPAGPRERLLAVLLQVHQPMTVTPCAGYGLHASYPSPRAYYPLRFALLEQGVRWQVDMRRLQLRRDGSGAAGTLALELRADFTVYAPLYNLFRKALFALEAGHFLAELAALACSAGLRIVPVVGPRALRLEVHDGGALPDWEAALATHRSYARERNSGRFHGGFHPAPHVLDAAGLDALYGALDAAQAALAQILPRAPRIEVRLCLRAGKDVAAGVYRASDGAPTCIDPRDPVDACGRAYNYDNFNFRTVPAVLFLCVDQLAFHCNDATFTEMNMSLGYLNQQLIRHLSGHGLVGRPFRSYDQLAIDHLLQTCADGQRAYYGLLVARNRCREAWGVLR